MIFHELCNQLSTMSVINDLLRFITICNTTAFEMPDDASKDVLLKCSMYLTDCIYLLRANRTARVHLDQYYRSPLAVKKI